MRALARRYRTAIVGDEVLTELTMDGPAPRSYAGDGTASAYVVSIGSASKSYWGGLRVGWVRAHPDLVVPARPPRVRTPTRDSGAGAAGRGRAARATRPTSWTADGPSCAPGATCWSACCSTSCRPGASTCPRGGLSLWADLGAPVSSALAAISTRHGVRVVPGTAFGVDGSFEQQPAAAVHHVPRRPAPSRRRAGRGVGGPGDHRTGHRTRPGARAGVTVRSAAA